MIRKKLIKESAAESESWLDLARSATFEVTSEEAEHPIEHALAKGPDNFSPPNATEERENFTACLKGVAALELRIIPERSGGGRESLSQMRIG